MYRQIAICILLVIFATIVDTPLMKIKIKKCTTSSAIPFKRNFQQSCVLDYCDMTLWCDMTNLTSLPYPETIKSQAPCNKSSAFYMNNSCVVNLDPEVLKKYSRLEVINFSVNLIEMIINRIFSKQRYLRKLDMSLNRISAIEVEGSTGTVHLTLLNLSDNALSKIKLSHLPADPHALANNTWICDCQMTAYWTFLKKLENTLLHSNIGEAFTIVCEFPNQLAGEKLSRLSQDELCKEKVFFAMFKSENEDENATSFPSSNSPLAKYVTDKCNETQLSDSNSSSSSPVSDITTPSKSGRTSYVTSPAYESTSVMRPNENSFTKPAICEAIAVAICIIIIIIVLSFCYKKMSLKEKGKLLEKQKLNNRTDSVTSDPHKNEKESNYSDVAKSSVSSQSTNLSPDSDESTNVHDTDQPL